MPIKYKKQPFSFVKRLLFWIPHVIFIPKSLHERIIKAVIGHYNRAITKILPLRGNRITTRAVIQLPRSGNNITTRLVTILPRSGNPLIVCKPQKDDLMIGSKKRPFRKRKRPLL